MVFLSGIPRIVVQRLMIVTTALIQQLTGMVTITCACALLMIFSSCSLRGLVEVGNDTTDREVDPSVVTTYNGAVAMYYSAIGWAASATALYAQNTGLMTDELHEELDRLVPTFDTREWTLSPGSSQDLFGKLSLMRILSQQGVEALRRFPTTASHAAIGELYALQGIAEVLLAEGFCSGVPLGSAPLGGGFQYGKGLTTQELLHHAIAAFDSALMYGRDSLPIATLARVGQGRAWSNLGDYPRAAAAVAGLDSGAYYFSYLPGSNGMSPFSSDSTPFIENNEGGNGMTWIALTPEQQDPRMPVTTARDVATSELRFTVPVRSTQYTPQTRRVQIAGAIEGRLIHAEAQLQPPSNPHGAWLATLNALRRSIGLSDTTDPGSENARVDLLFRERAFWLYGTGHRQGDLRRLIRQYGRTVQTTYPSGTYTTTAQHGVFRYRDIVTMDPGAAETESNPLYTGCFNRNP